jgi:hypothetical protein
MGLAAVALVAFLFVVDAVRARPPRTRPRISLGFRVEVATLFLLQPLARLIGRLANYEEAVRGAPSPRWFEAGAVSRKRDQVLISTSVPRVEIMSELVRYLRRHRMAVAASTGWEEHDCRVLASTLVAGDVISSAHVPGAVQIRVRTRLRPALFAGFVALAVLAATATPVAALIVLLATAVELARGLWATWFVIPSMVVQAVGVVEPASAARRIREPANL